MKRFNVLTWLVVLCVLVPVVFADGGMIIREPTGWRMLKEGNQLAAINYKEGFENLIIAVNSGEQVAGDKAVWIFPVPATPEKTAINILKGFPQLYGDDISVKAEDSVQNIAEVARASQIYPIPFSFRKGFFGVGARFAEGQMIEGVTVHETVTRLGVTTQLVTAKTGEGLASYVESKGLEIPPEFETILSEYIGQEFSFVVSWVSDPGQFTRIDDVARIIKLLDEGNIEEAIRVTESSTNDRLRAVNQVLKSGDVDVAKEFLRSRYIGSMRELDNAVSVSVTFPTDRMYYPLKPTSVYGSERVPTTVIVVGHVRPELFKEIKADSEVKYFYQKSYSPNEELREFFFSKSVIRDFKYTTIYLDPVSKFLVNDLWIDEGAPLKVGLQNYLYKFSVLNGIMLFVACSLIASLVAGMLVFKKRLYWFGFFNFLTLVGFAFATYFWNFKEVDSKLKKYIVKYSEKLFEKKRYYVLASVFGVLTLLWIGVGRIKFDPALSFVIGIGIAGLIVFLIFKLSYEKVNENYNDYFKDVSLRFFNIRRFLYLIVFNVVGFIVLFFGLFINYRTARELALSLGWSAKDAIYVNAYAENLFPWFFLIVFTASILLLMVFDYKFKKVHVSNKDIRRLWFVLLFTGIFVILTLVFQYILGLMI
ncbi:hypothetical protein KY337_02205 [Candidatus Woesearchaeota archaeon]|nr:hypothetical protein [Candidatus Woesearchaeota archaeon]